METAISTPPKIAYCPWITPRTLDEWSPPPADAPAFERLRRALQEYIDVACRPLIGLPTTELPSLSEHVASHAIAGTNARWRIVLALDEVTSGEPRRVLRLVKQMDEWLPELRERAGLLLNPDSVGCLEMGLRVHLRTLRHLIATLRHQQYVQVELPDQLGQYYELLHSAMCLDLCITTVLWHLDEGPSAQTAPVAEELCFLVKEYSLTNSALARLVFPKNTLVRRRIASTEHEPGAPTAPDRQWDRRLCELTLPDLRSRIAKID